MGKWKVETGYGDNGGKTVEIVDENGDVLIGQISLELANRIVLFPMLVEVLDELVYWSENPTLAAGLPSEVFSLLKSAVAKLKGDV